MNNISTTNLLHEKYLRAARMVIAILSVFAVTEFFALTETTWIYITIIVVMFEQTTIGGMLNKGYLRFAATFFGGIYSAVVIWLFNNNHIMNLVAFVVGIVVFSILYMNSKKGYIGVLGSATLVMGLINYNNISLALIRMLDILIGILISLFMLRFFYPRRATTDLYNLIKTFINELTILTDNFSLPDLDQGKLQEIYYKGESSIVSDVATYLKLLDEATLETTSIPEFSATCREILFSIKRVFRYYSTLLYSVITKRVSFTAEHQRSLVELSQIFQIIHSRLETKAILPQGEVAMPVLPDMDRVLDNTNYLINNTYINSEESFHQTIIRLIFIECQELLKQINLLNTTLIKAKL